MQKARKDVVWQGLIAGAIGYATIALCVGLADAWQGRSFFFTVSLLGDWLFFGLYEPGKVIVWPGGVIAFNGLHFATFMVFGLLASWLVTQAERGHVYRYASLALYVFVFAHLLAAVVFMTEPLRSAVSLSQIWVPSLLAVVFMSSYLLWRHPLARGTETH